MRSSDSRVYERRSILIKMAQYASTHMLLGSYV